MSDPKLPKDIARIERPVSLVSQVEKTLRRAIEDVAFPDGRLPTAVELAEQLGVSRETVRLALDSLQQEGLLQKRRRLGTFLNAPNVPSRLTAPSQAVFGYLQANYGNAPVDPEAVTRSVSGTMLEGALVEVSRKGFNLVVRSAQPSDLREAFDDLRSIGRLSGVVFASIAEEKFLKRLGGLDIPAVLLDHDLHLPKLNSVRGDSMQNARLAVQYLAGLGHRWIACVHWQQEDLNLWFTRGYREAMRDAQLRRRRAWELPVTLNHAGAADAVRKLMKLSPRPTAVICFNNTFASYLIDAANKSGLAVPNDLSVIGGGGEHAIGLTCNQLDWFELGRDAGRVLMEAVDAGDDSQTTHRVTPYKLQIGTTTGPLPVTKNARTKPR